MLGGVGRKARARAVSGALGVERKAVAALKGAQVILVDDVLTSGATSDACVRVLKRAGADKVLVACFARVIDEAEGTDATNETPGALTPGAP
jgi:predicted amidophosphoribosyltransferase